MAQISRVALFGKLNSVTYRAIEGATVFCKLRGNPYVEVAHWLHQLLQLQDSDVHRLVQHFSLDAGRLSKDLLEALDKLPRGASSVAPVTHVKYASYLNQCRTFGSFSGATSYFSTR